eukprot:1696161-Rhodomonas_salina.1
MERRVVRAGLGFRSTLIGKQRQATPPLSAESELHTERAALAQHRRCTSHRQQQAPRHTSIATSNGAPIHSILSPSAAPWPLSTAAFASITGSIASVNSRRKKGRWIHLDGGCYVELVRVVHASDERRQRRLGQNQREKQRKAEKSGKAQEKNSGLRKMQMWCKELL